MISQLNSTGLDNMRLDKWLFCARFYKSRSLARQAVLGGHIRVNKENPKPCRTVHVNDCIKITKGTTSIEIIIKTILPNRMSAQITKSLYTETQDSLDLKQKTKKIPKSPSPQKKPSKHDRKRIRQLKSSLD